MPCPDERFRILHRHEFRYTGWNQNEGEVVDRVDQAIAALKAETKQLEQELKQLRSAITALQGASNNGRGITARLSGRKLSASARRRIAAAQKARWAKWRAAQRKNAA
jgi:cell division protein FtsB